MAVRHVSGRGDGVVIHVETPVSRRQMDSISPPGLEGDPGNELADFLSSTTNGTGSWPESDAFIPVGPDLAESRLLTSVRAFERAALPPGDAATVTERAIDTLGLLIEALECASGDLPKITEFLERHRTRPR
jgi:hypothetical protein